MHAAMGSREVRSEDQLSVGPPTLQGMGYANLRELQTALTTASDLASSLQSAPTRRDADQLVDVLRQALTAASSLGAETGPTGCAIHPNGAVDPLYGDPEDPSRRATESACSATTAGAGPTPTIRTPGRMPARIRAGGVG